MFSTKVRTLIQQQWAGLLALFLVLAGGTAYATHPGGANTIGSGDVIDQQVRTQDIRDEAVTAPKLGPGSVNAAKIVNGQVKVDEVGSGAVRTTRSQTARSRPRISPPASPPERAERGRGGWCTSTATCFDRRTPPRSPVRSVASTASIPDRGSIPTLR